MFIHSSVPFFHSLATEKYLHFQCRVKSSITILFSFHLFNVNNNKSYTVVQIYWIKLKIMKMMIPKRMHYIPFHQTSPAVTQSATQFSFSPSVCINWISSFLLSASPTTRKRKRKLFTRCRSQQQQERKKEKVMKKDNQKESISLSSQSIVFHLFILKSGVYERKFWNCMKFNIYCSSVFNLFWLKKGTKGVWWMKSFHFEVFPVSDRFLFRVIWFSSDSRIWHEWLTG